MDLERRESDRFHWKKGVPGLGMNRREGSANLPLSRNCDRDGSAGCHCRNTMGRRGKPDDRKPGDRIHALVFRVLSREEERKEYDASFVRTASPRWYKRFLCSFSCYRCSRRSPRSCCAISCNFATFFQGRDESNPCLFTSILCDVGTFSILFADILQCFCDDGDKRFNPCSAPDDRNLCHTP